jgi:hypothetical protein
MASVGEIVRAVVSYSVLGASDVLNVFYWLVTTGDTDGNLLDDLETWFTDVWGPLWADFASENSNQLGIDVDIVTPLGVVIRNIGTRLTPVQGLSNAVPDVATVAGYLQADTANPRSRGRKFITGHPDDSIDNGYFDTEAAGDLIDMLALWLTDILGTDTLVLSPGVPSRVTETFLPFVGGGSITDIPAIQRRRKPNVGS